MLAKNKNSWNFPLQNLFTLHKLILEELKYVTWNALIQLVKIDMYPNVH